MSVAPGRGPEAPDGPEIQTQLFLDFTANRNALGLAVLDLAAW